MSNYDCCKCNCNPIDNWKKRTDVPQYGSAYLQQSAGTFFKDAKSDQLVSIYVLVRYIGEPPNMRGGGVYKIETAFGYPELVGHMYSFGYSRINEIKEI